jgi:uncharacterized protein YfaS (alpha-2-macroglobulin family)
MDPTKASDRRMTLYRKSSRQIAAAFLPGLALIGLVLSASCAAVRPAKAPDPARVEAHSYGIVPARAELKAVLVEGKGIAGQALPAGTFRILPKIAGIARWADERTLVFTPSQALKRGQRYRVDVDLGLIASGAVNGTANGAASGDDYFSFTVRASEQRAEVETRPPRVALDGRLEVEGRITFADAVDDAAVEKAFAASAGKLTWRHDGGLVHAFTVGGIARGPRVSALVLRWGAPLGGRRAVLGGRGSTSIRLPAEGSFELLSARASEEAGGALELAFSEALDKAQDLRGIVRVDGVEDLRYSVSGSTVSLYAKAWPASAKVRVEPGLRDASGRSLALPAAATVAGQWVKPALRFLTAGVILPTSQGLVLPVETMNLTAVVVEAVRVQGDNVLQFLQVNDLEGNKELSRVGEVVWSEVMELGWKEEWRNSWIRQGLDLGPLVAANKSGMFQIRVTFRHDAIRYVCPVSHDFKELRFPEGSAIGDVGGSDEESSYWDWYEEGYDYSDYYRYRDDPCHPAFYLPAYHRDIAIRRNVVVSDLGLVLKREAEGTWHAAASDLRSAKPLAGALVTLYNFQRRSLASATTGSGGLAILKPSAQPSFATLASGGQTSWLKVDPGSSLSIGHFDVGGEQVDQGLKGFLYGERGVWRPGDDMKLVFILSDLKAGAARAALPSTYPIKFELEDPLGRIVRTGTYTNSVDGFYAIEAGTSPDAPTGSYVARVKAGGRIWTKALKVETIMPNRLKILLDWGTSPYLSKGRNEVSLKATWLTGAQAGAFKADLSATFASAAGAGGSAFPSFPDYAFEDPTRTVSADRAVLFQDSLDETGQASIEFELSPEDMAPGKLKANLLTRVFEPSGVFSSENAGVDFHPYSRYVGLRLPKGDAARGMLLTDKDQRVDLVLVDRDGKAIRSGGEVEVSLYQLKWRWWWEKGDESLAERANEIYANPLKRDVVRIGSDGRAAWTFQVKYPSWGRFMVRAVDRREGHAAASIVYIDWPGWAGRGRDTGGSSAMLELSVGKPAYAPGETVSVSFPTNEEARALVTLERAGKILKEEWIATKKESTLYEFEATPDMAPNVYLHVTFVQPHLQTANDLPIRLYGVVPVMVQDPATRIAPVIEAPASIGPGGEVSFSVREASGRPMTCTIAVVDEGLLGITRYSAPNPWDEFYKKEASSLSGWDLYQYVAGAFSGKLETLLAVGGSDEGVAGGNRKPSRFPPVVYFFGPRALAAGETRTETFKMGPYIGAVRFMVVAASAPKGASGPAYGVAEKEVPVRADIMAQLTAPRVLSPGEEATLPATIFAFLGKKRVNVGLRAEGSLSLLSSAAQSIDFDRDGDSTVSFRVKAAQAPGPARLVLEAEADGKKGSQTIDIEVRAMGSPVNAVTAFVVEGGKTWSGSVSLPGAPGTNELVLELSRLKSIDLAGRTDWLIQYPHGCAEQTTSGAFPQIYLPKAADLSAEKAAEAVKNVAAGIERLRSFQHFGGGFTLWPGTGEPGDWLSAYVCHFLVSARREGYEVPEGLMAPALDYISRSARSWASTEAWSAAAQSYRLYVLALAGRAEIAAMNRFRDFPSILRSAKFRLAAAYALAGIGDAAAALIKGLSVEVESYQGMLEYTYGTPLRDRAVVLDALIALGDTDRALPVYNRIAEELSAARWYSTQDLGTCLAAALPYAMLAGRGEVPLLGVSAAGGTWTRELRLDKPMARLDPPRPDLGDSLVAVENKGRSPVFARLIARGTPAMGDEKAVSRGLSLELSYTGMNGESVDPDKLESGSDFIVQASIYKPRGEDYYYEERKPEKKSTVDVYDYQDVKDDRVLTYFSMEPGDQKIFKIYVNKTYAGRFYLPATSVEAMYDNRWQGISPGRWLGEAANPLIKAPLPKVGGKNVK